MVRQNSFVEAFNYIKEMDSIRENKIQKKLNESIQKHKEMIDNINNIRESREIRRREHSKLIEDCKNDALATVIKAIYIEALDPAALTDNGLILAESLVDSWIQSKGGASRIIAENRNKTYLLNRLCTIAEEAAFMEVDEIESLEKEETSDSSEGTENQEEVRKAKVSELMAKAQELIAKANAIQNGADVETTGSTDDVDTDTSTDDAEGEDNLDSVSADDLSSSDTEESETSEEETDDKSEETDSEDVESTDDSSEESEDTSDSESEDLDTSDDSGEEDTEELDVEVKDDGDTEEVEVSDTDTESDDTEEEDNDLDSEDTESEEDVDTDDSGEESDDLDSDDTESEEDVEADDSGEESDDTEDDIDSEDTESEEDVDSDDIDSEESDDTEDDIDSEDTESEEDLEADDSGEESDIEDDGNVDGSDITGDEDSEPTTIDGEEDDGTPASKGKIFDELEDEEDVQKAVQIISQRVADAEEDFIKRNAEDKKKIDDLIGKISDNIKTVENISNNDAPESKVAEESVRMYNRQIKNITENRPQKVFEKMVRKLSESTIKDKVLKETYTLDDGRIDMGGIIESAKVMYGFLEALNTLQFERVDKDYITNVLKEL